MVTVAAYARSCMHLARCVATLVRKGVGNVFALLHGHRLRTVVAVFLTRPALRVLEHLQANGAAEVFGSDLKGRVQQ